MASINRQRSSDSAQSKTAATKPFLLSAFMLLCAQTAQAAPVPVSEAVNAPIYLGDHTVNCFVPQVHLDMYLDARDKGIVGHLCRGRGWEEGITRGMLAPVKPDWTVVDVGANFGWHTLHFASVTRAGTGKVIAVEASPRTHSLLDTTLENAGLKGKVELHHVAVSDKKGSVVFSAIPDRALNNHIIENVKETDASMVRVPSDTLDKLLANEKRVDFIKIDVEGFESLGWRGLQKTLERNPNCIVVIECNTERMQARVPHVKPRAFYNELEQRAGGKLMVLESNGKLAPISVRELLHGPEVLVWIDPAMANGGGGTGALTPAPAA